ncbi:MAG: S8 family serine peptidase [Planctomycetes bacterium]|nr:S8 family serine peptidase [Planctomycetota bacterium]
MAASPGEVDTQVLRLSRQSAQRAAALRPAALRALDYGAFTWMELPVSEVTRLQSAGVDLLVISDPHTLCLGESCFDPVRFRPALPPGWDASSDTEPDLHLLQFHGPARGEWLDRAAGFGLQLVSYVHPHTYVVWGTTAERDAFVSAESAARWAGSFAPGYRVSPQLRQQAVQRQTLRALVYRPANAEAVVQRLAATGTVVGARKRLNDTYEIVEVVVEGDQIQAVAAIPGVYSLQTIPTDGGLRGELSDQLCAGNLDAGGLAVPGYPQWLSSLSLSGAGVTIANVDGGIQDSHVDLAGRMLTCVGTTCGGSTQSSHGTHTAGIMAADGSSGIRDARGFLRGLGTAPGANLVEQLYWPTFTNPGGMLLLMTESQRNGASLSGNSWGPAGTPRGYDADTLQVDIGVRDADPDAPGAQPLTYVLSFMNGNGGVSSQGTPDEAKNILTIGSTNAQNLSGTQAANINDISVNSAHGPALDGRTIPHLVAPGWYVDSTVPTNQYAMNGGTSMASPHVTGGVALFLEHYRNLYGPSSEPSPALVKAAFLVAARDLAGYRDADGNILGHPFDSKRGWGRFDLRAVVSPDAPVQYFDAPALFDDTGAEWTTTLYPADPSLPMRIMLVWTDAPGHGLGGSTPAWNNDLDLEVEAAGSTYLGNVFGPAGWSQAGGAPDGRNNTEGVFLQPPFPLAVRLRVVAANINSDGVPEQGDGTDQDFAVVCYNCGDAPDCDQNGISDPCDLDCQALGG